MGEGQIVFKYAVRWKVFDDVGTLVEESDKLFQTKKESENFALKLKKNTPRDKIIRVLIVKLEGNEIVRRYKKEKGRRNYMRR